MIITITKKQNKQIINLLSEIKSKSKSKRTINGLQKIINMFRNETKTDASELLPSNISEEISSAIDCRLDELHRNSTTSKYYNEVAKGAQKLGL